MPLKLRFVLCFFVSIDIAFAKIYERCELAKELKYIHEFSHDELSTWMCIAQHESLLNTSAMNPGSGDHGLFQISQVYWCSPPGHGCNTACVNFRDDNIADDVKCVRKIFKEHQRLFGNGFQAWAVYPLYCNKDTSKYIEDCFINEIDNVINVVEEKPESFSPEEQEEEGDGYEFPPLPTRPKVYNRCELAHELRDVHKFPEDEISKWVCIVEHESNYNTSATNPGSGDHGLFQISEQYWCSRDSVGFGCNANCASFRDSNIADDIKCIRRIYDEHTAISGDGFNAWVVYPRYCKSDTSRYTEGCFATSHTTQKPTTIDDGDGYEFPPLPNSPKNVLDNTIRNEDNDYYEFPALPNIKNTALVTRIFPSTFNSAPLNSSPSFPNSFYKFTSGSPSTFTNYQTSIPTTTTRKYSIPDTTIKSIITPNHREKPITSTFSSNTAKLTTKSPFESVNSVNAFQKHSTAIPVSTKVYTIGYQEQYVVKLSTHTPYTSSVGSSIHPEKSFSVTNFQASTSSGIPGQYQSGYQSTKIDSSQNNIIQSTTTESVITTPTIQEKFKTKGFSFSTKNVLTKSPYSFFTTPISAKDKTALFSSTTYKPDKINSLQLSTAYPTQKYVTTKQENSKLSNNTYYSDFFSKHALNVSTYNSRKPYATSTTPTIETLYQTKAPKISPTTTTPRSTFSVFKYFHSTTEPSEIEKSTSTTSAFPKFSTYNSSRNRGNVHTPQTNTQRPFTFKPFPDFPLNKYFTKQLDYTTKKVSNYNFSFADTPRKSKHLNFQQMKMPAPTPPTLGSRPYPPRRPRPTRPPTGRPIPPLPPQGFPRPIVTFSPPFTSIPPSTSVYVTTPKTKQPKVDKFSSYDFGNSNKSNTTINSFRTTTLTGLSNSTERSIFSHTPTTSKELKSKLNSVDRNISETIKSSSPATTLTKNQRKVEEFPGYTFVRTGFGFKLFQKKT